MEKSTSVVRAALAPTGIRQYVRDALAHSRLAWAKEGSGAAVGALSAGVAEFVMTNGVSGWVPLLAGVFGGVTVLAARFVWNLWLAPARVEIHNRQAVEKAYDRKIDQTQQLKQEGRLLEGQVALLRSKIQASVPSFVVTVPSLVMSGAPPTVTLILNIANTGSPSRAILKTATAVTKDGNRHSLEIVDRLGPVTFVMSNQKIVLDEANQMSRYGVVAQGDMVAGQVYCKLGEEWVGDDGYTKRLEDEIASFEVMVGDVTGRTYTGVWVPPATGSTTDWTQYVPGMKVEGFVDEEITPSASDTSAPDRPEFDEEGPEK